MNEIISTVSVEQLLAETSAVNSAYRGHCLTYIPMGDVSTVQKHFVDMVRTGATSKGMITAPYGYGKTATALSFWFAAEEAKFLAIPPFTMTSLFDILRATYAWAKFRFAESMELAALLEERYQRLAQASMAGIAKEIGSDIGVSSTVAQTVLEQFIRQHSVSLNLSADQLFTFLRDVAELAKLAGFRGLVIFPDELQQYLDREGTALKHAVQELRSLVWRLKSAQDTPIGISIIFIASDTSEQQLTSQGNDILDRLKEDRLYLNLRTVYDAEFPARLWQRYGEHFKFSSEHKALLDPETLRSIGQIAVRENLGRGPRTVVDCIKLAIQHRYEKGKPYSPIDLIDDFRLGRVAYEARNSRLRTVVNEVLESKVVDTEEKERAIKLLAAFPRGCERNVWRKYNVEQAVDTLASTAHGEHLKYLSEGYTLRRLVEEVADSNVLVRIIDTHVHQNFSDLDLTFVEKAAKAFITYILRDVFESRRSPGFVNWGNTDFKPTESGTWLAEMTGSFFDAYPRRILAIQVALDETKCLPLRKDADIQYDFILMWGQQVSYDDPGSIQVLAPNHIRFVLNLRHRIGERLPSDLRKLDDILSPNQFTPVLMLSLVATLTEWMAKEGRTATATDQGEANMYIDRLKNHSINRLFSDGLLASASPRLNQVELRCIEELFLRQCKQLFPNYRTLLVQPKYKELWDEFNAGLDKLEPRQRKGIVPIVMIKKELAALFGLANVTNWDVRVSKAFKDVVKSYSEGGRGESNEATLHLKLHPLEEAIVQAIENSPIHLHGSNISAIEPGKLFEIGKSNGYCDDEVAIAADILLHRHILGIDEKDGVLYLRSKAVDPDTLRGRIEQYRLLLENAPEGLVESGVCKRWESILHDVGARISAASDESVLDDIDYDLGEFDQRNWQPYFKERQTSLQERLENLIFTAEKTRQNVGRLPGLDAPVTSVLPLAVFLNEFRSAFLTEQRSLLSAAGGYPVVCAPISVHKVTDKPSFKTAQFLADDLLKRQKTLNSLDARWKRLSERCNQLAEWVRAVRRGDTLYNYLGALPELRTRLVEQVCFRAQQDFNKRKEEALANWEEFQREVSDIELEHSSHVKVGQDEFSLTKSTLETMLRRIQATSSPLRAGYTFGSRDESYANLCAEVADKLTAKCMELERRLGDLQLLLLKAEKIQMLPEGKKPILAEALTQHHFCVVQLSKLSTQINRELVSDTTGTFEKWIASAVELVKVATEDCPAKINSLLVRDGNRSSHEQQLWTSFNNKREADLTDLIVQNLNQENGLTLDDVLNNLKTLYRKNQVKITISRIE